MPRRSTLWWMVALIGWSAAAAGADDGVREFRIPAGPAADTLPLFARQAEQQIVFAPDEVAGVSTHAVEGRLQPRNAIAGMLAGTGLVALADARTGAIAIHRPRSREATGTDAGRPLAPEVRGRVRHAATGALLEGARVELRATGRTVFTQRDGSFLLRDVPPGPVEIAVSYTGLERETAVVPGGRPVEIALQPQLIRMGDYVVSDLREGQALALTQQRNAVNVKEVVATDAFGNLRDGNVGELLVLLPGVVGEWVGNDVRTVHVRGFHPNLGAVTLDGAKLANAESAGLERNFEWDAISADHIESVEVIKVPTPDMAADAIGGVVNLRTKSALNQTERRRGMASAGVTYESVRGSVLPNASLSYSELLGAAQTSGFALNWGFSRHNVPRDGTQISHPASTAVPNHIGQIRLYDQENIRERAGGGLRFDFRVRPETTVSLNLLYSWFREQTATPSAARRLRLAADPEAIAPGFGDDHVIWLPGPHTTAVQEIVASPKEEQTGGVAVALRHRGPRWSLDAGGTLSRASTTYDSSKYKGGIMTAVLRGAGFELDRRGGSRYFPRLTQTAGPDVWALENYAAGPLVHRDRRGEDAIGSGHVDVEHPLGGDRGITLKAGWRHTWQRRDAHRRDRRYAYLGPDGRAETGDEGLARFADAHQYGLVRGRYAAPRWLNVRAVADAQAAHPGWFAEDLGFGEQNRLAHDRSLAESVSAGYAMATARIGRLTLLGGLRYERTEVEGEAGRREISPEEQARRAAWAGPVTEDEAVRRVRAEFAGRTRAAASYAHWLPGLHLRYETAAGLVARASVTTAVGRPNFRHIVPDTEVDHERRVIHRNNTQLEPQFSRSLDVGLQYYFEPAGVISLTAFQKRIDDFIMETSTRVGAGPANGFGGGHAGYDLRTELNAGAGTVRGIEINVVQPLSFLPGRWGNLTLMGNYARLETTARPEPGGMPGELEGFVPESANFGLTFASRGLELRVKSTYKGEWLSMYSPDPGAVRYTESRINWDLNLMYRFTPRYAVFLDWLNIFDGFDPDYQYRDTQVRTYIPSGSRVNFGLRVTF